jgi:hypothetical protein
LDPEIVLSEGHRSDMLLDLAGLDKHERTMIQASIGNARDFDRIADALVVQHPRVHLKHSSAPQRTAPKGGGKSFGKGFGKRKYSKGKGKRSWRNPSGFANLAADDWDEEDAAYVAGEEDEEEPYSNPAHWFEEGYEDEGEAYHAGQEESTGADWTSEFSAYVTDEWSKRWNVEDPLEVAELESVACLFDFLGPDCLDDPATCSDFIQTGAVAFLAQRQRHERERQR